MRLLNTGLLLVLLGGLCATSLHAYEPGDFAPRGSLLYYRINDLSGAMNKVGGEAWKDHIERMLLGIDKRDMEDAEPIINEIRSFIDYMGTTESFIGDVMVREPFVQMASVTQLKEGAPTEFSPELLEFFKEEAKGDVEVTPNSIKFENGAIWLKGGLLVNSTGGMMDAHIEDVLDGFNDESLSQVERFTKWSNKAKGEVVLYADMKAWRTAIDRLGEDFDAQVKQALETIEWQKWDIITGRISLPSKTSGLSADLSLSLNQPFEHVNAFMKPSGGSKLVNMLPTETVGFLTMQLGREHQRTMNDLLNFFHDFEQNERPARLKRQIEWAERDVERTEERLARLLKEKEEGSDKDATTDPEPQDVESVPAPERREGGEEEYDPIQDAKDSLKYAKEHLAELQSALAAHKYRAFEGDPEVREGGESDAEGFSDNIDRALLEFGFTRDEVLDAIGQEVIVGIMELPDPGFADNDLDDAFADMWFALVETQETFPELKERFLDRLLARKLPGDMPEEEEKEEAKRRAEKGMFKKVEGGELIREKGLRADWVAFAGEGFVGFAPNEEVALRILKAAGGNGRTGTSKIPGGMVSGSKFAYVDLGRILGKLARGEKARKRRWSDFPRPDFRLDNFLPAGFHLSVSTDESNLGLNISLRTGGESNLDGTMEMIAEEIIKTNASRHDERVLRSLEDGIQAWVSSNSAALAEMDVAERTRTIKNVTPEMLAEKGLFIPMDGLRSAFDPAMADRFEAMLQAHERELGPAEGSEASAIDLSESSFEWFGLPVELGMTNDKSGYDEMGTGSESKGGTPICAMKGDWANGGRYVLIWSGGVSIAWYDAEDYAAMMDAQRNGNVWQPTDRTMVKPPKWRVRKLMRRKSYDMYDVRDRVRMAMEKAIEEGREIKFDFKGKDKENALRALRELLALEEDDWFHFEDAKNLNITTDEAGKTTARYENWGHWVEIDEEGEITSSFDE